VERIILMPEIQGDDSNSQKIWRRIFYSIVLTSVEFFLAIIAILAGVPVLLDPFSLAFVPASIAQLMPIWMVDLWGLQMVLGGVTTSIGIMRGDFRIEQIGVLLLLAGAFVYMFALLTLLPGSWVAFITYVLFSLAMLARYWVLGRLIKLTGRLVRYHKTKAEE
jgi:hypothetical protein